MPITDKFGLTLFNAADAHNTTFEEFWKAICLNDETSNFYKLENNVYSKGEIDQLIGSIETIRVIKVEELPETGESNVIYLVPQAQSASNAFDEYLWIDNTWEQIGSTEISLDNYYNKTEVDAKLAALPQVAGNPTLTGDEPDLQGIQIGDQAYKIPENTAAREIVVNGETHTAQNGSITLPNYPIIDLEWADFGKAYQTAYTFPAVQAAQSLDEFVDGFFTQLEPEQLEYIINDSINAESSDLQSIAAKFIYDTDGNLFLLKATSDFTADVVCFPSGMSYLSDATKIEAILSFTVTLENDDTETGGIRIITGEVSVHDSYTKAEIQTLLAGKSYVRPNIPLAGTETDLTSLEVDGVNYKVSAAPEVVANPTLVGDEDELIGLEVDGVNYKVSGGGVTQAEYDWLVDSVQTLAAQSGHSLAMASYQDGTNTTLAGEDTSGAKVPIVYENVSN